MYYLEVKPVYTIHIHCMALVYTNHRFAGGVNLFCASVNEQDVMPSMHEKSPACVDGAL